MQLILNEEQQILAKQAAQYVGSHSPITRIRKLRDTNDATGYSAEMWKEMAQFGWVGANIPEQYGGAGLGFAELCVVLEAAGRRLMPEPFFSTVLLGANTLLLGGSDAQKQAWLPKVAAGEAILTVAFQELGNRYDIGKTATKAKKTDDGFVLSGTKTHVADGHVADRIIVPARTGKGKGDEGITLFLVDPKSKGVKITRQSRVDSRNVAIVKLSKVAVTAADVIGTVDAGGTLLSQVQDRAIIGLSAEMLGAMTQAYEDTVEYLKTRKQFGVAIGTFQALQHRAARLFVKIALVRSTVLTAARTVDEAPAEIAKAASMAKALASDTFVHVANEAIQMHGGVGMTDEFDVGFYIKRARAAELTLGDAPWHRSRWATLSGY